jgi:hypothetical protein
MTILAGFTRAGFVHWNATVSLLHPAIKIIPTITIIISPVAIAVSHCATADQLRDTARWPRMLRRTLQLWSKLKQTKTNTIACSQQKWTLSMFQRRLGGNCGPITFITMVDLDDISGAVTVLLLIHSLNI